MIPLIISAVILSTSSAAFADGIIEVNDSDWPPYFFAGAKDKPDGFGKELLQHCFAKTGVRAEFRHTGIKRAVKELEDGTLDVNVYSRDPRRENMVRFGEATLFRSDYRPFVRSDANIKIRKLTDFDPLRIGNLAGLTYTPEFSKYLESREKKGEVTTVNTPELNIRMLVSGKIDTFVNTTPTVLWEAREIGLKEKIKPLDYVVKAGMYHVAVSRKSKRINDLGAFLEKMDRCLTATRETSFYKALSDKYLVR
ncbi:hypothetical protein EBZ80_16140 [bacterium]|nr:hypothetical protein [bacterium]